MPAYIIGYDLNKQDDDYAQLHEAIKAVSGTWWHNLDSTWIVVTHMTAEQIRDRLIPHLDDNDELLVVKSGVEAAWHGFKGTASSWLATHL